MEKKEKRKRTTENTSDSRLFLFKYDDYLFISSENFNYMIAINLNAARNKQLDVSSHINACNESKKSTERDRFVAIDCEIEKDRSRKSAREGEANTENT